MSEHISRKEFLKKGAVGLAGLLLVLKDPLQAEAAVARDNLNGGGGGVHIGPDAPANKGKLWVDTTNTGRGVLKYWNGTEWSSTASVWDN